MTAVLKDHSPPAVEQRHVSMPTGELDVQVSSSDYDLDTLIGFAARANAKRGFLFLSKVLGKHWPVKPQVMLDIHQRLAAQIPADAPEPIVFVALAETAIGLGQGVFENYLAQNPKCQGLFLHTSRYRVGDAPIIEFEESHSHAPRQFLHMPQDPGFRETLMSAGTLVLVDDEISTGNTFANLIAACRGVNHNALKRVHLATIINFMGTQVAATLSARFGLEVSLGAVLTGRFQFAPGPIHHAAGQAQRFDAGVDRGASAAFGRLGLDRAMTLPPEVAEKLAQQIQANEKVLVLGTGEFMHPAFLLGLELEARGIDVVVQSTTRSPILQWGAVSEAMTFPDNYGEGIANYLYNVAPAQYEHVFICHETPPRSALYQLAGALSGRLIHFRSEDHVEEVPFR